VLGNFPDRQARGKEARLGGDAFARGDLILGYMAALAC